MEVDLMIEPDTTQGVCGLCVLSVAKSAATHVLIEVNEAVNFADLGFGGFAPSVEAGGVAHVSNWFAAQPERVVRLAQTLPRTALRSFVVNQSRFGLWPALVFAGTPICVEHIYWADEIWGVGRFQRPAGIRG